MCIFLPYTLEDKLRLFAAVMPYGRDTTSGHYIAFVELGMKWFRTDDMNVRISNS